MEPVDFNELLQRGARETLAADLGIDPSEMQHSIDEKPVITPYKTEEKATNIGKYIALPMQAAHQTTFNIATSRPKASGNTVYPKD